MKHSFVASNSIGGIGEALFFTFASKYLKKSKIEDVSKKKEWQKKGIDFRIDSIGYDVKFDTKAASTGNLALETVSKAKDGEVHKEGWAYTSEADCIVYATLVGLDWAFYFFTRNEILHLIDKHTENRKSVYNYGYNSEVVLVPKDTLSHKKIALVPLIGNPKKEHSNILKEVHEYFVRRQK